VKNIIRTLALIALLLFGLESSVNAENIQHYAVVNGISIYSQGGLFGYSKDDGSVLTKAIYDYVAPFRFGYAVVGQSNLLGCIDIQGNEVIPCKYDAIYYATDDSESMRFIVGKDKAWGVLDGNGGVICDVAYDMINGIINNNIIVEKEGLMGLVDLHGNLIIPMEWEWIYYISDGWAMVYLSDENDGSYTFVDTNNKAMQTNYAYVEPFNEGCAFVMDENESFFINTKGERVSFDHWDDTHSRCSQALIGVLKNNKWGYISQEGNIVIPPQWEEAYPFSQDGLALVRQGEFYGYIDKTGTLAIETMWPVARDFINGYAIVATETGYGLIDTTGEYVILPNWHDICYPAEGMIAIANDNNSWGFVDMKGQLVVECNYSFVDDYCDGCVRVWDSNDNVLWLDKSGAVVCPPILTGN